MDKIEKATEMIEKTAKSGKAGTIVGAIVLGFAGVGIAEAIKKTAGVGQKVINSVFPVKEEAEESTEEAESSTEETTK